MSLERITGVTLPNKLILMEELIERTTNMMLDEDTSLIEIPKLEKKIQKNQLGMRFV